MQKMQHWTCPSAGLGLALRHLLCGQAAEALDRWRQTAACSDVNPEQGGLRFFQGQVNQ
jgi:hypothetical protein